MKLKESKNTRPCDLNEVSGSQNM